MMNEAILQQIIGPLVGGGVAIIAGGYSFRLSQNGERQRSLNLALYHLLRVHRYAEYKLQNDPESLFDSFIQSVCEDWGGAEGESEMVKKQFQSLQPLVESRYREEVDSLNPESINVELQKAIMELSKVAPELAHRIEVRSTWKDSIDSAEQYTQKVLDKVELKDHEHSIVRGVADSFSSEAKLFILECIRDDLLQVAKSIGWRKYRKIKKYVSMVAEDASAENQVNKIKKDLDSVIHRANRIGHGS